ncbi:hypothetical protein [Actinomyces ruminicola]|nr:hypothetical protein [Actinomyces ruminicola]
MTALERLNNFNLIKTNSPLVTEHIDVTPYNVPVIQGLCLLTLDGITPSIPFAENGKPRNIAPQAPDSFAQTGRAMLLQTHSEGSRIFPEIDTFIVGDPVNTHGTLNRNLLVGNARFRLGSVIDKRASWRNFDKRFVDYSAAKSATLAHRGIDISDLPEGRHRVVAEISYPGNPQEVVTTEVRSKRPIGCLAVSARQHRLFFLQAAAEGTTATVVDPDTLPSHNSCVHVDVLGINASDHRLRLRGRFFPPGLIAEQWGDCEYRLMLDDGQLLTSIELGLLDRPHESLPNTLRRAYFSDMNLEGIDISGLPRRRYLLYVVAFNASVLARTRPLGILDCSNKGTSLDAITQRQSEV